MMMKPGEELRGQRARHPSSVSLPRVHALLPWIQTLLAVSSLLRSSLDEDALEGHLSKQQELTCAVGSARGPALLSTYEGWPCLSKSNKKHARKSKVCFFLKKFFPLIKGVGAELRKLP